MASDVDVSTVINRPVAEVFAYVSDFEHHPDWERNFKQVRRVSTSADGTGTTYECVFQVPGQRVTATLEITEWQPNQRVAFRADKPAMARPAGAIVFEPAGEGTRVTLLPRPQMGGAMRLLAPLMAGYIRKSNIKHLALLKARLEKGP
jgi:uncharacterized protein YndB with AHSA1/START domain